MNYQGDIRLGDTIDFKFCTVNTSGVPTTLAGTPVISAYPGNSTTELTAGITLTVDFDSRTGMHNVRVVASSGNGYATATNYQLVITAGTVGGNSVVGYVIGSFSIEARSALMPATAGRTAVVDAAGLIDANTVKQGPSGSGVAQTARDMGASVLLSSGTGTGQVSLSSGTVTVGTNNDKTGYALTSGERNSVADALLDRDMSVGTDSGSPTVRTVRQALRFLRNKWALATGTLTVYKEDDSTSSWTATVATDAAAVPITGNDPA